MFTYPKGLYTDVRIEEVVEALTQIQNGDLKENKQRKYKGIFIRLYDGKRWYYSSITEQSKVDEEIAKLAQMATANAEIESDPVVKRLEVNRDNIIKFESDNIEKIAKEEQVNLLKGYEKVVAAYQEVKEYALIYKGNYVKKSFYSSKGAEIVFDKQVCGLIVSYNLNVEDKPFRNAYQYADLSFEKLKGVEEEIKNKIDTSIDYIREAKPVQSGKYPVIFSPMATGIFAHESFGHKSEADLMLGSETMKEEWKLGKKVGSDILSIIDRGDLDGNGYVPYDDEGNKARINTIIDKGILKGRLHSGMTANILDEEVTGNARAMNFEYEPIVRMTTTYVEKGNQTKEELFEGIKEGVYVADVSHGSGMSAFTIAPAEAYMIRDGKLAEPVTVSVVTGNVMETLYLIDGVSNELELLSFVGGGCGKGEQWPLPVGFGGPYIRVKELDVQ